MNIARQNSGTFASPSRKIKNSFTKQLEHVQAQYRLKMQEITEHANRMETPNDQSDCISLLEKHVAMLKMRLGESEQKAKSLEIELKIAEADRRSQVENLSQQVLEASLKATELQAKFEASEKKNAKLA